MIIIVNMTTNKVDEIKLDVNSNELEEIEKNEVLQIALASESVQKVIDGRGYEVYLITMGSWQEVQDGKTMFHIFPSVELFLYPRGSENLKAFVDLEQKKVVRIEIDASIPLQSLERSAAENNFTLTLSLPRKEYQVGETVEATMTLIYSGLTPLQLRSPGGEYFDILIRDSQDKIIYRWSYEKYPNAAYPLNVNPTPPEPGTPLLPLIKEDITSGFTVSRTLEFCISQPGSFYVKGSTLHCRDGSQVGATKPDGSGFGVNVSTPFITIQVN